MAQPAKRDAMAQPALRDAMALGVRSMFGVNSWSNVLVIDRVEIVSEKVKLSQINVGLMLNSRRMCVESFAFVVYPNIASPKRPNPTAPLLVYARRASLLYGLGPRWGGPRAYHLDTTGEKKPAAVAPQSERRQRLVMSTAGIHANPSLWLDISERTHGLTTCGRPSW